MKEVETRHKPIGCGTPKATADHEIGHEIDKILNASSDMKINEMYKKMVSEKNAREMLSGYSETNVNTYSSLSLSFHSFSNNLHYFNLCSYFNIITTISCFQHVVSVFIFLKTLLI